TDVLPYPAAAPAPSDPEWVGLDSYWYELLVPVREVTDRWRVGIGAVVVVPPVPTEVHDGAVPPWPLTTAATAPTAGRSGRTSRRGPAAAGGSPARPSPSTTTRPRSRSP